MKRLFIVFMVLALSLSLTGAALAAGPKAACFRIADFVEVLHLTFKALGTMKTSAGKVKMYAVHGEITAGGPSVPLVGTAHIQPGTSTVHFSVAGQTAFTGAMQTYQFEGFWDTAATTLPFPQSVGTISYRFFLGGAAAFISGNGLVLNSADCTAPPAFPYDEKTLLDAPLADK